MIDGKVLSALERTNNGFYDISKALSYDRPAIIQLGFRSGGKSTTDARLLLFDYIYNGHQWLYIRRTKDELDKTKKKFFDDAIHIINTQKDNNGEFIFPFYIPYFVCEAGLYKIVVRYRNVNYETDLYDKNGEKIEESEEDRAIRLDKEMVSEAKVCGLSEALSMSQKVKSGFFNGYNIWWIVYDEFIAEHQTGYLGSNETKNVEYQDLISIFVSADRGIGKFFRNEVKILLVGNLANLYNPILLEWGVNKYYATADNPHFIAPKNVGWILEVIRPSKQYIEQAMKSNAWLLMRDEEREYNIGNKPRSGEYSSEFIMKDIPPQTYYLSGVILNNIEYGVYRNSRDGNFYINKFRKGGKCEALDIVSYANGNATLLCQSWNKSPLLNLIHEMFLRKKLYFNNKATQMAFLQYLDFIPK